MKEKKGRRGPLDADDVIAGRSRPEARELIALIRDVNPTGRGLPPKQTAARYAQKSRLQSVLVTRFQDEIDVREMPDEPGVVSLLHRPSGLDACHAVIAELEDDARSWVQRVVDIESTAIHPPPEVRPPSPSRASDPRASKGGEPEARSRADEGDLNVSELLSIGREAILTYEYDTARTHFEAALARSDGETEPATALLTLLIDHLGADEDALALEEKISEGARRDPLARALIALAAARLGHRERALRLLKTPAGARGGPAHGGARRIEPQPARTAEVFIALARGAIERGLLDEAAEDLAQVRERAPASAEILGLSDAIAKRRAMAREPAETELSRLFAAGDIAAASHAAGEILARWPDSQVARRIARTIDEQRRREEAEKLLASARDALAAGETMSVIALLRRALGSGLQGDDAAWAERRIASVEAEARAREEHARIEAVRRLILAGDFAQGLSDFAALDAPGRQAVKEVSGSRLLGWLDALAPPDADLKAKPAISAVLALERAAELAAHQPKAALDMLAAHGKVLEGFKPAEEVSREARRALTEIRQSPARRAVDAARRALAEGKLDLAHQSLREAPLRDLPEDEQAAANELWTGVRRLLERQALASSIEELRRAGDELRALSVVDQLHALVDDAEKPQIDALRPQLRAEVQRRFRVHVEHFTDSNVAEAKAAQRVHAGAAPDPLWHPRVTSRPLSQSLLVPRDPADPRDGAFILAHAPNEWVFLQLIDIASGRSLSRVALRTPKAMRLFVMHLLGRRLILLGKRGALLEISIDTFEVERWCPNIIPNGDAFSRIAETESLKLIQHPEQLMEDATISPDGRSAWVVVSEARGSAARHTVHVIDLRDLKPIHHDPAHDKAAVRVRSVPGLKVTRIAVTHSSAERAQLYESRGVPSGALVTGMRMAPNSFVASPDGEHILVAATHSAPPSTSTKPTWAWTEIQRGAPLPLGVFHDVTDVSDVSAIVSLEAKMTFFLFELQQQGCLLFGLRHDGTTLVPAYRAALPKRSMLAGDSEGRRAFVLVAHGDRVESIKLGAEPPEPSQGPTVAPFQLPNIPLSSALTTRFDCYKPTGAPLAAAMGVAESLQKDSEKAAQRRIDTIRRKGTAEHLIALEAALFLRHRATDAELICAAASERFPDHPRVRLAYARPLSDKGWWSEVRRLLSSVRPADVDKSEAKHLHHMKGLALMMLDEPEAALVELHQAAACAEGRCAPGDLIAVCTPLSDTATQWTPEQERLRDLMTLIAKADAALARGDATSARLCLDCNLVFEANEVQSFARLSEAYLLEERAGAALDPFRMAFALLTFCNLVDSRRTLMHREMPLPRATWRPARLEVIAARARERAEAALNRMGGGGGGARQ